MTLRVRSLSWARRVVRLPGSLRLAFERLEDRTLLNGYSPLLQFPSLAINASGYDTQSILVRFKSADLSLAALPGATADALPLVNGLYQVKLPGDLSVAQALAALQGDAQVAYAQPNYAVSALSAPSDPQFGGQWALHNPGQVADINAPEAWSVLNSSPGVIVAVIDTGVDYTHPDLAANIWVNAGEIPDNGIDDDNNGYIDDIHGYDFYNRDGDPMDDHGHGTHVAGIIGAVGNNGIGIAGVTWNVQIMPIKFLGANGTGYLSQAIEAINYAVANGATISNNSWSGGGYDQALADAIATAGAMNHLFVTAAGNSSHDIDLFPTYPAAYGLPNILVVAATDQYDQLASFSNYGANTVHLAAPGVNILSTVIGSGVVGDASGYGSLSGTSMAAPLVAGAAALLQAQGVGSYQQIVERILSTVDPLPDLEGITVSGGRLNLAAALNATPAPDIKGPRVINHTPAQVVAGSVSSVRVTFNESIDPATFTVEDIIYFASPYAPLAVTAVAVVAGTNDRQFDLTFEAQTTHGDYAIVFGPDIRDLAGNRMDQDKDGILGEEADDVYSVTFSIAADIVVSSSGSPAAIQDFSITISQITVSQSMGIGDVNVLLNVNHPNTGDLHVYLVSPYGTIVTLSAYGGAGANFSNTVFDDEASIALADGAAPFAGSFRPDGPLAPLIGQNAHGVWTLFIEDWGYGNQGELANWSLIITPGGPAMPVGPTSQNSGAFAFNDYVSVLEDTPTVINVLANDLDLDGGSLVITEISAAVGGTVTLNGNNTVTFTPAPDWYGPATFSYTVSDGQTVAVAEVFIDVFPLNDAPVAVDDFALGQQDTPLIFNGGLGNAAKVTANDIDVDGPSLWIVDLKNFSHGEAYVNKLGDVVFVPETGYTGLASFDYTISDGMAVSSGHVQVYVQPVALVSTTTSGAFGGATLGFSGADIVKIMLGPSNVTTAEILFDGSDVGLNKASEDIDAFVFLPNGSILISTVGNYVVPAANGGTLKGGGEDILQFWYVQLGETTVGYWTLYFDGGDVGLAGANIDALAVLPTGQLLISTAKSVQVPNLSATAQDLMIFTPSQLGKQTSGKWALYFDGSDVGLTTNAENITAVYVQVDGGGMPALYFSTAGDFKMKGLRGSAADVIAFQPTRLGVSTKGTASLGLNMAELGLSGKLDGFRLGAAPLVVAGNATSNTLAARRMATAPSPPAAYLNALAVLPASLLERGELAPYEPVTPDDGEGPVRPATLPDGTPLSPILVHDAINRLFSAWGRPGEEDAWLPNLPGPDEALPLLHLFTTVIQGEIS